MNDSVPEIAERLLEALGADSEFCSEVLGDLTEEHASRLQWDGPRAARLWYYREAMRVAPYLVRDWRRRFGRREAGELVGVLVWSTAAVAMIDAVFQTVLFRGVFLVTGIPMNAYLRHWEIVGDPLLPALLILWTVVVMAPGGAVAASIGRRAPLTSALAAAAAWGSLMVVSPLRAAHPAFLLANLATMLVSTMVGAIAQTLRRRRPPSTLAEGAAADRIR